MDKPDLTNKCYRTKSDKLHATIWWRGDLTNETIKEREDRLDSIKRNKGTWVYDPIKREVVRKEDLPVENEIDVGQISRWDPEWSVLSTGKRMSKGELKRYCREHGKSWEN